MWITTNLIWPIRRWIQQFPKLHWVFLVAKILAALFAFWWWHSPTPPPPGYAVAVIAVLAALMSIQEGMKGWQRAIWMLVIGAFLFVEIRAINSDRATYAKAETERRKEERTQFQSIADGISATIEHSDEQFSATMGKTNEVLQNMTGGDSFMVLTPADSIMSLPGGKVAVSAIPVVFGKYPMREVAVALFGPSGPIASENYGTYFPKEMGRIRNIPQLTWDENAVQPVAFYALISAENGYYSERIEFRKVGGFWRNTLTVNKFRDKIPLYKATNIPKQQKP